MTACRRWLNSEQILKLCPPPTFLPKSVYRIEIYWRWAVAACSFYLVAQPTVLGERKKKIHRKTNLFTGAMDRLHVSVSAAWSFAESSPVKGWRNSAGMLHFDPGSHCSFQCQGGFQWCVSDWRSEYRVNTFWGLSCDSVESCGVMGLESFPLSSKKHLPEQFNCFGNSKPPLSMPHSSSAQQSTFLENKSDLHQNRLDSLQCPRNFIPQQNDVQDCVIDSVLIRKHWRWTTSEEGFFSRSRSLWSRCHCCKVFCY